jgi:CheY-like chemotaxis protein
MAALNGKSVEILLVEDNPADVRLTREIFEHDGEPTHLNVVGSIQNFWLANARLPSG